MARSAVNFALINGQLGQQATGTDFISGLILYGTAPGSFATTATQAVFSLADAVTKGITLDYADETLAKGIITLVRGATGDTIKITVTETNPVTTANPTGTTTYTLCNYTQVAGDSTDTLLAVSVAAAINANSYLTATSTLTGYTCTSATGVLTLTARQGTGIMLNNATSLVAAIVGTATATITQQFGTGSGGATAGVYSKKAVWNYIVSEFFRANPTGKLWVNFTASVTSNFAEIATIQTAASGQIKQLAIFNSVVATAAQLATATTAINTAAIAQFAVYTPLVIHYGANTKAIADYSTLTNLQTKTNNYVVPVIMQDGGAAGAQLYINSGVSIPNVGFTLGTTSAQAVNEDIGVGTNNITNDVEMAIPALTNGVLISAATSGLLDTLDSYRYLFATPAVNYNGVYINNDWTATISTDDYSRQSRQRVMNKAVRGIYASIYPLLKSQIQLNTDGTITEVSAQTFIGACTPALSGMKSNLEISNYAVTLNRAQNVISTGKVVIAVRIQPTVTADFIEVDMSFVAKL